MKTHFKFAWDTVTPIPEVKDSNTRGKQNRDVYHAD